MSLRALTSQICIRGSTVYEANLPAEHRAVPLWGCEDLYWEDFEIGHRIRTIRRTLSEGESMAFNTLVVDIHPYVADEIFAREEGMFGRRLVAGVRVQRRHRL
jgi:acyl dehydratase